MDHACLVTSQAMYADDDDSAHFYFYYHNVLEIAFLVTVKDEEGKDRNFFLLIRICILQSRLYRGLLFVC